LWTIHIGHEQIAQGSSPQHALPIFGADSVGYIEIADNLRLHGEFRLDREVFQTFRTPGYPVFMMLAVLLLGSYFAISFLQILLTFGTAVLLYFFLRRHSDEFVARITSILFLLSASVITQTLIGMSEILFVFLFVALLHVLFWGVVPGRAQAWIAVGAGALMGAAILTRPIAIFLPVFFLPFFIWSRYKKESLGASCVWYILILVTCALAVVPWMMRNERVSGTFGLSTVSSYNWFHYNLPEYASITFKRPLDDVRAEFEAQLSPAARADQFSIAHADEFNAISLRYFKEHAVSYTIFHLAKTAPFFLTSGVKAGIETYNTLMPVEKRIVLQQKNISTLLLRGQVGEALRELAKNPITFIEQLLWMLVCVLLVYGAVRASWSPFALYGWMFFLLIISFAILTGPVAYSRFRIPVEPLMFALAIVGSRYLVQDIKNKFTHHER
jgi:4-amino-4-deoxy-L-arabinose transferase-like glycosyltransferase